MLLFVALKGKEASIKEKIVQNLEEWRVNYVPEKVYLHHDKPYYVAGDQVWLKAYVVNAVDLLSSAKSGVLYVDLLDEGNAAVAQLTLPVTDGIAVGDILVPDNLPEGNYTLTGYTRWMRNFGAQAYFNKSIQIVADETSQPKTTAHAKDLDLQFFPEGGDLIAGLSNKIAFKAIDESGLATPVNGGIFDDEGRKITDFNDHHQGMGLLDLVPEYGSRYFAKVNFEDGSTRDYPLPEAMAEGYTMQIDEVSDPDNFLVDIETNMEDNGALFFAGIARESLHYSETVDFEGNSECHLKIPKADFPTGIVRFTLSDDTGTPYAERLAFINQQDQLEIKLSTRQNTYIPREKITIDIEASKADGTPVSTDFSIAVTDDGLVGTNPQGMNINTYLLLHSDLRGYVQNPGYYFEAADEARAIALQHLMMTQGWRGFSWSDIVAAKFPEIVHTNESDLSIRGKLVTDNGKNVEDGEVILYLEDKHQTFIITETDNNGKFSFEGFNFQDSINIIVQGTDSRGRRSNIEVKMDENRYIPDTETVNIPPADLLLANNRANFLNTSRQRFEAIDDALADVELGEVVLRDVVIEDRATIIEPFRLHDRADVVLNTGQLPISPSGNILESMQGRVAGLQITQTGQYEFRASIRGQAQPPLYLLDGIPIAENTLFQVSQFDISRIEVLKNPASAGVYGGRAGGGVIALFTKRGTGQMEEVAPGPYIINHRAAGFSRTRTFYAPKYTADQTVESPDLRNTIYWNPTVSTDKNGKASVTMFAADRGTRYRVAAEGIANGKPGSSQIMLTVESGEVSQ